VVRDGSGKALLSYRRFRRRFPLPIIRARNNARVPTLDDSTHHPIRLIRDGRSVIFGH